MMLKKAMLLLVCVMMLSACKTQLPQLELPENYMESSIVDGKHIYVMAPGAESHNP